MNKNETLASVAVIKSYLNANYKPENKSSNVVMTGKTNLGAEFITWLESIKAFDSRPQTGLWQGAYQNQ